MKVSSFPGAPEKASRSRLTTRPGSLKSQSNDIGTRLKWGKSPLLKISKYKEAPGAIGWIIHKASLEIWLCGHETPIQHLFGVVCTSKGKAFPGFPHTELLEATPSPHTQKAATQQAPPVTPTRRKAVQHEPPQSHSRLPPPGSFSRCQQNLEGKGRRGSGSAAELPVWAPPSCWGRLAREPPQLGRAESLSQSACRAAQLQEGLCMLLAGQGATQAKAQPPSPLQLRPLETGTIAPLRRLGVRLCLRSPVIPAEPQLLLQLRLGIAPHDLIPQLPQDLPIF